MASLPTNLEITHQLTLMRIDHIRRRFRLIHASAAPGSSYLSQMPKRLADRQSAASNPRI